MNAKYTFGGISKRLGKYKVRVGQGDIVTRTKIMLKEGHEELDLVEFDRNMTKADICKELLKIERFQKFADVINETYNKKMGLPVATTTTAKPTKAATPAKAAKPAAQPKAKPTKVAKPAKPKVVIENKTDKDEDDDLLIEELKKLVA